MKFYYHDEREEGPDDREYIFDESDILSWPRDKWHISSGTFSFKELMLEIVNLATERPVKRTVFDSIQILAGMARDMDEGGYVTIR